MLQIKLLKKFYNKITIYKIIALAIRFFSMKKCYFLFFLLFIFFLNFSCKKTITPAYLLVSVEDLNVNVSNFNQEHETDYDNKELEVIKQQNFRDVYVSLNGKGLGYWQLPCKIPLIPDYTRENFIRITPCVRLPHLTLSTVPYSFLLPIEQRVALEEEGEYRLSNLDFVYAKSVAFPVLETFAQTTIFKSRDTVNMVATMEIYTMGDSTMGRIALEDSLDFFNVVSPYFELYGQGVRQYWEMYYKCDNGEMTTYLEYRNSFSITPQQDMIVLPATKDWKKIYIDITDVVSWACGSANKLSLRLGIRGLKNSNGSNAYFYFENVKVVTMAAPY